MNQEELLATRYGKKPTNKRRQRATAIVVAAVALVTFLTWAISVTSSNSNKITAELHSYQVIDDHTVKVELTLEKALEQDAVCQVEALADDYEVAGYKEVAIPAGQNAIESDVSTVKPAVSAVVKDCWFK